MQMLEVSKEEEKPLKGTHCVSVVMTITVYPLFFPLSCPAQEHWGVWVAAVAAASRGASAAYLFNRFFWVDLDSKSGQAQQKEWSTVWGGATPLH